jgi:hypothetical protein
MELSDEAVQRFKEIWKKECGQELTYAEAREQGTRLIEFFRLLIEIDRREGVIKKGGV